jgi:hypothetical protein
MLTCGTALECGSISSLDDATWNVLQTFAGCAGVPMDTPLLFQLVTRACLPFCVGSDDLALVFRVYLAADGPCATSDSDHEDGGAEADPYAMTAAPECIVPFLRAALDMVEPPVPAPAAADAADELVSV